MLLLKQILPLGKCYCAIAKFITLFVKSNLLGFEVTVFHQLMLFQHQMREGTIEVKTVTLNCFLLVILQKFR